ncbi:LacI family transcriptional regulator [Brucella gallinifaecis]|uniref:LacI family transcriptional regulator n=2 Tax=Brucella gallinifaecis TaxID=215590 RepID=A0A502BTL8_9HYPH|nr:LacI family transcriptional regulator [Brucella gallinifaecis]
MASDERKKRATINDVAELAGVAVGTVSRYLNNMEIRKSNRQEIERAIETLGFQRNAIAAAMKNVRTGLIGLLVPVFDEFHAELLNHLVRVFRQENCSIITYCHDSDAGLLRNAIDFFAGQRIDALIMAGSPDAAQSVAHLIDLNIPVVIYNNDVAGPKVDRVFVDNANASFRAVSHLIETGHKRIAHISGASTDSSGVQRREGYERALQAHGIALRGEYLQQSNWSLESGYDAVQTLMSLSEPPTAVYCANYQMTMGVLEWMREHRLSTPDDLAIVSFDDVELFRLYDGGVTAVAQPVPQIANSIKSYVMSRLLGGDVPDIRSRTLDCDIILRGSSGKPIARNQE